MNWKISCSILSAIALYPNSSILAQVTTDGTTSTTVIPTETGVQIDNGSRTGDNLFHSFDEFSVPSNTEAFFNNANDVVNIFSRVTGGNISNIDGTLRANGAANLFLINPAGIVFGENARLQLGGSFYGSTADSIIFPDGKFSATDLENPPLITVNAPIGLGFRDNPNSITVRGNGNGVRLIDSEVIDTQEALRVDSNATIGLIGGELIFEDATIKTPGGSIELGSVAGGEVDLVAVDNGLTFDYSEVENFQDISLFNTSTIDASGLGGGDIRVVGKNITVGDISGIEANTLGDETPGEINLFASESISISGIANDDGFISGISSRVFPNATADSGNINIETQNLTLGDRASIETSVSGQGNAGEITINARDSVSVASEGNNSAIISNVNTNAIGNGGDINIDTSSLNLSNGAFISATTFGQGNAGNVTVNANDIVSLDGGDSFAAIATFVNSGAVGNAGDITIITPALTLTNNAFLLGNTSGQGNAGKINFSGNSLTLENDSFFSTSVDSGQGNGGDINVTTGSLSLSNGSNFNSTTSGQGNGGNVTINAIDNILLDGRDSFARISTGVNEEAVGNGGNIDITTGSLIMQNDARLIARSLGDGNAGNVTVNARENINFDGRGNNNGIISDNIANSNGKSGDIELNANSLTLNNGSEINNTSVNRVGDISLNVTENISLTNLSGIFATGADRGSITLEAKNLELATNSRISAGIDSDLSTIESQAGDIAINLTEDLSIDGIDGELTSIDNSSFGTGNAGNTEINARNILLLNGGFVTSVSSGQGNIGSITLNATQDITIDGSNSNNSQVSQFFDEGAAGDVGSINLQAQNLTLTNGGQISSGVLGTADSGDINILVADTIIIDGLAEVPQSDGSTSFFTSSVDSIVISESGNSGNINLSTKNLLLSRNGNISSIVTGNGNAGNINIDANVIRIGEQGNPNLSPSRIISSISNFSNPTQEANAGNITINTDSLAINDGGTIGANANSIGNGGSITINAIDSVTIDGVGLIGEDETSSAISASVSPGTLANGGEIEINTANLFLTNRGSIRTSSEGDGDAGNVTLNISDTFLADNSSFIVSNIGNSQGVIASGKVGNIIVNAKKIAFSDTAQIQAGAFSGATAEETGIVSLTATESISFTGQNTGIFSNNDPNSFGDASDTKLFAPIITLDRGARIVADNRANDQGGNVTIETERLTLNNSSIVVNTFGEGDAGSVTINAMDSVLLTDASSIEAVVRENAIGDGGNITLETKNLIVNDGAEISVNTLGRGNAGSVTINATESIALSGRQEQFRSGLFAKAHVEDGAGGDIFVSTNKLTISDGAIITGSNFDTSGVNEPGTGEAGSLTIKANSVTLSNDARIDTVTQAGDEGNITLDVTEDLILRDNSVISTQALKDATGGNININSKFIIAFPSQFDGNDIRADANQGQGGNINITAESIFGIAESKTLNPLTNDINASSQVSGSEGIISINTPDINPLRASSDLPSNLIATNTLTTTNACQVSTIEETSNLIVTGKGGILPEMVSPLTVDSLIIDESTVTLNPINTNQTLDNHFILANTPESSPADDIQAAIETEETGKLIAAKGIVRHNDGTIYLTAYSTSSQSRTTDNALANCIVK